MNISVIIPAHNEAGFIGPCLEALLEPSKTPHHIEILVVVNGATDDTVRIAHSYRTAAEAAGIALRVLETDVAGKGAALNLGDCNATGDIRVYLDADVVSGSGTISALGKILDVPEPRFASGNIVPATGSDRIAKLYARIWTQLPFVTSDVCGCGLYAVNKAGRTRWDKFPLIHSDDRFVRLQFTSAERFKTTVPYEWPVPEGLRNLIRVRSRWCRGNSELVDAYPELLANDMLRKMKRRESLGLFLKAPVASMVFTFIYAAARLRAVIYNTRQTDTWERGR